MKKMLFVLTISTFILCSNVCYANQPFDITEEFFSMVQSGKIADAFDKMFLGSEIKYLRPRQIQNLQDQTSNALTIYGDVIGFEKIREEGFGKSTVRMVYLLEMEKTPLVWEIYFYKPKANWFVVKINFSDRFLGLEPMK